MQPGNYLWILTLSRNRLYLVPRNVTLELYSDFLMKTEAGRCSDKVVDDISEAEMSSFYRFTVQEII